MESIKPKQPRLIVKGIKTFRGHDGVGLNATLYFDGKKVCEIFDDAHGGEWELNWFGATRDERDRIEAEVEAYVSTLPTKFVSLNLTATHLHEYGSEMTTIECPNGGHTVRKVVDSRYGETDYWCPTCNVMCEYLGNTLRSFVDLIVDEAELDKTLRRKCKTGTLIRRKGFEQGEYVELKRGGKKVPYTPALKPAIMKAYPDCIEIINERYL